MQVLNCFKIKSDASSGTKTFTDSQLGKLPNAGYVKSIDPIEEAAVAAAFKVADAENRSFVAAEAIKEAERISKMAEDTDSMLQFAKEIFEKCNTKKLECSTSFLVDFHFSSLLLIMLFLVPILTGSQGEVVPIA